MVDTERKHGPAGTRTVQVLQGLVARRSQSALLLALALLAREHQAIRPLDRLHEIACRRLPELEQHRAVTAIVRGHEEQIGPRSGDELLLLGVDSHHERALFVRTHPDEQLPRELEAG